MEKSSITRDFPIAKAAYTLLKDSVSSSFGFPGWNKGRIVCQKSQLKRILSNAQSPSEEPKSSDVINLSNLPFPLMETRTSRSDVKRRQHGSVDTETGFRTRMELTTSTV